MDNHFRGEPGEVDSIFVSRENYLHFLELSGVCVKVLNVTLSASITVAFDAECPF